MNSSRSNAYTHAIVLPNSLKSALVPFFADIPVRTGFRGEYRYVLINDMRMLLRDRLPRMIDRFNALGVPLGAELPEPEYPALMIDEDNRTAAMDRLGLGDGSAGCWDCAPAPNSAMPSAGRKRTSGQVADRARSSAGMQVWIFGGPDDARVAGRVRQAVAPEHRDASSQSRRRDIPARRGRPVVATSLR
ncbi:MAG: glycosyltransferase family 9 protein [Gammaproteobacteria bacterium]|nr:glycosyltransferase family 9 protein [Gammaproteobacteria bacterium]